MIRIVAAWYFMLPIQVGSDAIKCVAGFGQPELSAYDLRRGDRIIPGKLTTIGVGECPPAAGVEMVDQNKP